MSSQDRAADIAAGGLKHRQPDIPDRTQHAEGDGAAERVVKALNAQEELKDGKERKTYGRTPEGVVFTVPHTEDMVSQLFDPTQPKNASDVAIVTILAWHCLLLYLLPQAFKVPVFAVVFLFWRACYNAGIGWLLHNQSHHKLLTVWAKRYQLFENPQTGNNPRPFLWKFLKQELEAKIPNDYRFEDAPLEYNTWLLFRRVVDLILMSDFTSYCLFAITCGGRPLGEAIPMTIARWACGIGLILFNLWVKLDAHRVVKDFAWYWGDFFYLVDQELTFDGVFELAPHPMYSVGYAGFYGISLIAASYKVLFISIVAHAAQFAFLTLVESPHIEKTYNSPPPPPKRVDEVPKAPQHQQDESRPMTPSKIMTPISPITSQHPSSIHNLFGLHNLDLHRVTDVAVLLLQVYMYIVAFVAPSTWVWQTLFVVNAAVWRIWYAVGIGFILDRQSNKKRWTRHFLKYGESTEEAWQQWKGLYHVSMVMCYTSFVCAAWKMYHMPADWTYGMATLRHVVGFALVALQIWTIVNIYESLGEFGWFFGDFFFTSTLKLNYGGIYRFLNNPERTIGLAGVWGVAILTWSKAIFFLAFLSHILTLCFIQFVERPHMQKLYRQSLRADSGVSKNIKRSLPSPFQKLSTMDRMIDDSLDFLEEFIDTARPKLGAGFNYFVKDSMTLLKNYPARISIKRLAPDLAGFDPKDYSLIIDTATSGVTQVAEQSSQREGAGGQKPQTRTDSFKRLTFDYGTPIRVKWAAPLHHGSKDWIGLYMVADNASREITNVSSQGRWISSRKGAFDHSNADNGVLSSDIFVSGTTRDDGGEGDYFTGEVEFSGDKLWWTQGVFEFRYHHDGKHNVMAISLPFEITVNRFDEDDVEVDANGLVRSAVEEAILPVVQNCFDRDEDVAPRTVDEPFGSALEREGKFARRVVYAIQSMFGIEFAPGVVQADGNVRNLAWRICNAKKVLAPYSMSGSDGRGTPS